MGLLNKYCINKTSYPKLSCFKPIQKITIGPMINLLSDQLFKPLHTFIDPLCKCWLKTLLNTTKEDFHLDPWQQGCWEVFVRTILTKTFLNMYSTLLNKCNQIEAFYTFLSLMSITVQIFSQPCSVPCHSLYFNFQTLKQHFLQSWIVSCIIRRFLSVQTWIKELFGVLLSNTQILPWIMWFIGCILRT